ncbi:MAG TPA: hypothetical protein VF458_02010, partial [Ktedonobacteraceae bacterium]
PVVKRKRFRFTTGVSLPLVGDLVLQAVEQAQISAPKEKSLKPRHGKGGSPAKPSSAFTFSDNQDTKVPS